MSDFFTDIDWSRWSETIWTAGARVLIVVFVIFVALRIIERLIAPALRATITSQMAGEPQFEIDKRIDTLSGVANRTLSTVAVVIALLTVLPSFGINIGALLAGAGVVGIAIGLGAQSLVRDVLGGLFILIENQYGRGDVVNLAGVGGVVEDVNLRRTLLRDMDGTVHSIPHSAITVSSNKTRALSRVNMVVTVRHGEDLDRVFAEVNRIGEELARDPAWANAVTSPPKALGVDDLRPAGIDVRILGETLPNRQWDVMREMRLRLAKAFETAGINLAVS
jgi:small conductance mechanosensitive channel